MRGRVLLTALLAFGTGSCSSLPSDTGRWQQLFDGRTLRGWTPKIVGEPAGADAKRTFIVENGAIRVSYANYDRFSDRFGHLFFNRPLRFFRLKLRYRFLDVGLPDAPEWARSNSGIMFLAEAPGEMAIDQPFPVALEFQILGRLDASQRPTGAICTPGTAIWMAGKKVEEHCSASNGPTIENKRWVTAELEVLPSGTIVHRINGVEVIRYAGAELDPADPLAKTAIGRARTGLGLQQGYLALQSEGHAIEFAGIELQELSASTEGCPKNEPPGSAPC